MNEANLFSCWLYQERPSTLTRDEINRMTPLDITTKFDEGDLIAVLYYGKASIAIAALNCLKEKFECEMHHLESLTYPQEIEA